MGNRFYRKLDQLDSSYVVLISLIVLAVSAGILFQIGLVGRILTVVGNILRTTVRTGFRLWERLFAWASWPIFLVLVLGLLTTGIMAKDWPIVTILCALMPLFMGATACLAYMFIDLERYEVERGYKAVHNPLKGQELALHLVRYGQRVRVPLLVAATIGMIGGFALLNQGVYETIGREWYIVEEQTGGGAAFVDFLAYALINLLRIVDVLNLANSHHLVEITYVRQAAWPAAALLAAFRLFFTFVLLQQLFASVRQGKLLSETIADLWSPHEPIHERARNALPQYGPAAIGPLLVSLRSITSLTKEQRDQLPPIIAAIGPSTIPDLIRHVRDSHESVRAVAVSTLGQLHARDAVPLLIQLGHDPSDMVRQSMVEALGLIGGSEAAPVRKRRWGRRTTGATRRGRFWGWRKPSTSPVEADPIGLAASTLAASLTDAAVAVRTKAALALAEIGSPAKEAVPGLIALCQDSDEQVRRASADALGKIGESTELVLKALIALLQDESHQVKAAAAQALGTFKKAAAPALHALLPLLQDREELVRTAVAEAIGKIGPLNETATNGLVEGLSSKDSMVRAQTAEALGTIGAAAQETAPALVEAMADSNDSVRAKAVEALGKIGEAAAEVAVPYLVRALSDQDNWVSSLAAEALGQMGESGDEAIPALTRALGHINPQVRANAAEALGKMGTTAGLSAGALEKACSDPDDGVRREAVRALRMVGPQRPSTKQAILTALEDANARVRAAAVEALAQFTELGEAVGNRLLALLEDPNDDVKVETAKVLPKLVGPTQAVIDALCRRLSEDDSEWVQIHAALALGRLGPAAAAAQEPLVRAALTGEVNLREQAMRAIVMIQPPDCITVFSAGLKDASGAIRKVASAGLMKAANLPPDIVPALLDALRDPEVQVRANAAQTLGRFDPLPAEAIPFLIECTTDLSDGLRINAAGALKNAPRSVLGEVVDRLIEDPNIRIRLIAANMRAVEQPDDARVIAILLEASADPTVRVRQAVIELIDSLGPRGAIYLNILKERLDVESDPGVRKLLADLLERLPGLVPTDMAT